MTAPRISVLLLACNQQATARAAAESCLAQRGEPLEIILSDDASTDDTYSELQAAVDSYQGPHSVRAQRNATNMGIGAHYNLLIAQTQGDLLVTAAGDDLSVAHRVQRLAAAWDASNQRADLISSHFIDMAADGTLGSRVVTDDLAQLNIESWCRKRPYTVGATHAFTRRVMDRFGPFIENVWYEDPVITFRAMATGGAFTVPEALVHYRQGGTSRWPQTHGGAELVHWMRTQNRRVLAEILQHTQDAALVGVQQQVRAALAPTLARENYLAAMMNASDAGERWAACRAATELPLEWRLRKLLTFTFPDRAASLKNRKSRWRGR